jgi:hypothetical protein
MIQDLFEITKLQIDWDCITKVSFWNFLVVGGGNIDPCYGHAIDLFLKLY